MRVGYVVHTYPALSHAFIQREIQGLRRAGVDVRTMSVHRAEGEHILSDADREEAAATESILPPSPLRIARAHLRALRHLVAYVRTLRYALHQSPPGLRAHIWQLFYFAEAVCVWAWAERQSVDHLHAHLANVATDAVWLASIFDRAIVAEGSWRWSFTMHGPTEFFAVERFNLARKVMAADGVVCISDFCRSQLMLLCPPPEWDKLVVVHCGADLDRYRLRATPPTGDRELSVICVGRLVARKGQAILLEALSAMGGAPTVTFVGSGPGAAELEALAAQLNLTGRVTFAGPRSQDEMPGLLSGHDVFCLASFSEGVPVVLMEAMATGLPVVSTPIAGIPELIADGTTGLLVAPGRVDLLAEGLTRLQADPDLRARLSHGGRDAVERAFDAEKCAAELAGVFGRMVIRGARGPASASAEQNLLHDL